MDGNSNINSGRVPGSPPSSSPSHLPEKPAGNRDIDHFSKELADGKVVGDQKTTNMPSPGELLGTMHSKNGEKLPENAQDTMNQILQSLKSAPAPQGNQATLNLNAQQLPDTSVIVKNDNGHITMTFETSSNESLQWLNQNRESLSSQIKSDLGVQELALNFHMPSGTPSPESLKPFTQKLASHMADKIQPMISQGGPWSDSGVININDNPLSGIQMNVSGNENSMNMTLTVDSKEVAMMLEQVKDMLSGQIAGQFGDNNMMVNLNIENSNNA